VNRWTFYRNDEKVAASVMMEKIAHPNTKCMVSRKGKSKPAELRRETPMQKAGLMMQKPPWKNAHFVGSRKKNRSPHLARRKHRIRRNCFCKTGIDYSFIAPSGKSKFCRFEEGKGICRSKGFLYRWVGIVRSPMKSKFQPTWRSLVLSPAPARG
jgi:hypothetical protein